MNPRKINSKRARRVMLGLAALAVVLVAVVIATSAGGSTSTNTATSSPTAASASASTSTSRTALQKCLKEHGVTIAPHTAGNGTTAHSGPPPGRSASGSGNAAHQAAFKACGAPGQHATAP